MSAATDKMKGLANEALGNAKQGLGKAIGSNKLRAEGFAQNVKGRTQRATGAAKATVKSATNKVARAVNKSF